MKVNTFQVRKAYRVNPLTNQIRDIDKTETPRNKTEKRSRNQTLATTVSQVKTDRKKRNKLHAVYAAAKLIQS